jgi:hypothetical protein
MRLNQPKRYNNTQNFTFSFHQTNTNTVGSRFSFNELFKYFSNSKFARFPYNGLNVFDIL